MLVFGLAIVLGLLLTPQRKLLRSRWLLAGGVLAFLVVLPHLLWEIRHGFPHLEVLANIRRDGRDVPVGLLGFWSMGLLFLNPAAAPVWLAGLVGLFAAARLRTARALGWVFVVVIAVLFATTPGSHKTYYATAAYPMLLAAGATAIEAALRARRNRWLGPAYCAVLVVAGAVIAPTVVPILRPETYLRYTRAIGIAQPKLENRATSAMPQLFADRFGWPEMAATVAQVYQSLPSELRSRTGVYANDFGQGGAIDFYGPQYGLPKAIGHLSYWYWGPREYTGESLIVLGDRREVLEREFEAVEAVPTVGHPYAMQQEHFTVFLCRRPRGDWTLASVWPRLKNWR
jgi:hypothetical protein